MARDSVPIKWFPGLYQLDLGSWFLVLGEEAHGARAAELLHFDQDIELALLVTVLPCAQALQGSVNC